ncbi:hypothetical protein AURDEDRAFT_161664 [Auricularia subglabra TFB-10046 SS5]|nr:hypothetical protein AURDEDRAFT_161664 [Auricularia subglabra TFB-10046 SS5]
MVSPRYETSYLVALGTVIRLQSDLLVTPESKRKRPSKGDWLSLDHSNELISQRFGYRSRPYAIHEAKSASAPLLREMAAVLFIPGTQLPASARVTQCPIVAPVY